MKKLFFVLLIVFLLLPCFSFADDPIVGNWYVYFNKEKAPELSSAYQNLDMAILVYSFLSDGTILQSEIDIKDGSGSSSVTPVGKWEKKQDQYSYSIIVLGTGPLLLEDDCLLLSYGDFGVFMKFRPLVPMDPYADYIYK